MTTLVRQSDLCGRTSGAIAMTCDPATNWLTRVTYPTGHFFAYTYNVTGQRTQRADQDGRQLNYTYDAAGRLTRIADETDATIVSYTYDGTGRLERKTLGNDTYATYEYDTWRTAPTLDRSRGRRVHSLPLRLYLRRQRQPHVHDHAGRRYDLHLRRAGQLTGTAYPGGRQVTYAYDAAGNRTVVTENGSPTSYTTNNLNHMWLAGVATYTYDANGSLTAATEGGQTTRYFYDYENRLVRVETPSGTVSYTYDPLGRRIARTDAAGTLRYLHDGDHVAAELDAAKRGDRTLRSRRGDRRSATDWSGAGTTIGITWMRWSVLTAADGHMLESYSYDAYGEPSAERAG